MASRIPRAPARLLLPVACLLAAACSEPPLGVCEDCPGPDYGPADWQASWSRDGQWLAFTHGGAGPAGVYIARVDGTERRLVAPGGHSPDWSPDGSGLVFVTGAGIRRLDLASDSVVALTTEGGDPAWSPTGSTIVYHTSAYRRRSIELWLMDPAGGNQRRVPPDTIERDDLAAATWAPFGDRLVANRFQQTNVGGGLVRRLFITDTLGRDTSWVTPESAADIWIREPEWSPTGEWIAYMKDYGRNTEIRLVRPDGTGDYVLVPGADPAWSPDGKRVAFSRYMADNVAIWSVDLSGRNARQLSWPRGPTS